MSPVPVVDYGAGSKHPQTSVASIARSALKSTRHAAAIQRCADHVKAKHILELGTSLGLTTAYLAQGDRQVTTLEGNPVVLEHARVQWKKLGLNNIQAVKGPFSKTLPELIVQWEKEKHPGFELIFIDGHHYGPALMEYVHGLKPWIKKNGILICDDIHWSPDMEAAWIQIMADSHWRVAVDLFEWGFLTAHPDLSPQNFRIRI